MQRRQKIVFENRPMYTVLSFLLTSFRVYATESITLPSCPDMCYSNGLMIFFKEKKGVWGNSLFSCKDLVREFDIGDLSGIRPMGTISACLSPPSSLSSGVTAFFNVLSF